MAKVRAFLVGLFVFAIGFSICGILASFFNGGSAENTATSLVFFALLYLSAIVSAFAYILLERLPKRL